jgi:hypothetical protein
MAVPIDVREFSSVTALTAVFQVIEVRLCFRRGIGGGKMYAVVNDNHQGGDQHGNG